MEFGSAIHAKSINKRHARWNVSFCLHQNATTPKDSLRCFQDDPETPQRRPPGSPRRTQGATKTAPRRLQDGPRYPQDGPNCAQLLQRAPRSPLGLDFGPSRPRFWTLQTMFFNPPHFDFNPIKYRSLGAVAGTQVCCAFDPPRQASGLRMAYGVTFLTFLLILLSFSFPS